MYIITKEKQYYYLTNEEENKKYSLNINTKEIKNEKINRILKKLPNIRRSDLKADTLQNNVTEAIIKLYRNNTINMFSLLEFSDKMSSLYISLGKTLDLERMIWTNFDIKNIIKINNNFSDFIELLKIENYPEDILSSINKYPYYLLWKDYKNLINFTDFFLLFNHNCFYFGFENSNSCISFIIKVLRRAKFFPLSDDYNYSFLRSYCSTLRDYFCHCLYLKKSPRCENNMIREINETEESYSLLKTQLDKERFKENYKKQAKAWDFSYSDFIVTIPIEPKDLIIEGQKMHHCVGNYINNVINNETYIVFIRKKDDIKTPYITAQVDLNGTLRQYYLAYDKEIVNEEDIEFKEKYQEYLNRIWDLR